MSGGARTRFRVALISIAAALWFAGLMPKRSVEGAAASMHATALSLARSHTRDLASSTLPPDPSSDASVAHDGHLFARQPIGAAVLYLPAAFATLELGPSLAGVPIDFFGLEGALLGAILCALFFSFGRRWGDGFALGATAALALSTGVLLSARIGDANIAAALLLFVVAREMVCANSEPHLFAVVRVVLAGGALIVIDPIYSAPVSWILAFFILRSRMRLWSAIGVVLLLTAFSAIHLWHVHSAGIVRLSGGDFWLGLDGLLLSTGKSLLFFSPPLLLSPFALKWFAREDRWAAYGLAIAAALGLCAVATLPDWHGDPSFGPIRAVAFIPLLLMPLAGFLAQPVARARRRWAVGLAALGLGVQLLGAAFPPGDFLRIVTTLRTQTGASSWFHDPASEVHFIPQFSPLTGHAWMALGTLRPHYHMSAHPPWRLLFHDLTDLDEEQRKLRFDFALIGSGRAGVN